MQPACGLMGFLYENVYCCFAGSKYLHRLYDDGLVQRRICRFHGHYCVCICQCF